MSEVQKHWRFESIDRFARAKDATRRLATYPHPKHQAHFRALARCHFANALKAYERYLEAA